MTRIALATAVAATGLDEDMPALLRACAAAGFDAQALAWDDPTVSWTRFDAVLLRSTWDYTERLPEFLNWCERVDRETVLLNPLPQFHVGGSIFGALSAVAAGWTVVIPTPLGARNPNVVRDWWSLVERNKVTLGGAVPTTLAGTPATVTLLGTGLTTTEPAAMRAQ